MEHFVDMNLTYDLFWYFSGNFSFPAVVQGLTNMLKDTDPNIRAVATIALAKSGLYLLYHCSLAFCL